jgi:hypothetical protein
MTWCDSPVLNRWPGDKHRGTKHIRHGHYDKHAGAQSQKLRMYCMKKAVLVNKLKTMIVKTYFI